MQKKESAAVRRQFHRNYSSIEDVVAGVLNYLRSVGRGRVVDMPLFDSFEAWQ